MKKLLIISLFSICYSLTCIGQDQLSTIISLIDTEDLSELKQLVKDGYDINSTLNEPNTNQKIIPLIYATCKGKKSIVSYLLKQGANVNVQTEQQETALMLLAHNHFEREELQKTQLDLAKILINAGADLTSTNTLENTVSMIAAQYAFNTKLSLLLHQKMPEDINQQNKEGNTVWHLAAQVNNHSLIKALLVDEMVNFDLLNHKGYSPITTAYQNGHNQSGELFIMKSAAVNFPPEKNFYDSSWIKTVEEHASYYIIGHSNYYGKYKGKALTFYKNGQLKAEKSYEGNYLEGWYTSYYPNGQLESKVKYQEGERVGLRVFWFDNGQKKEEWLCKENWAEVLQGGWQKDGIQLVIDGQGNMKHFDAKGLLISQGPYKGGKKEGHWKHFYDNGQTSSEGNYYLDKKEGLWTGYWEDSNLYYKENYQEDKMTEGTSYKGEMSFKYIKMFEKASFQGGQSSLNQYIRKELQYPETAVEMDITGKVKLQFTINTKGEVTNIEVIKKVHSLCDQEAIRVIQNSPNWIPAKHRGINVSQRFRIPINFQLR